MVAPVPAQILKLRPRLPAAHLPPPTFKHQHALFSSLPIVVGLCFHTLTNPSSRNSFIFTSIQLPRSVSASFAFRPNFQVFKRANSFVCIDLEPLCPLFVLFAALVSFVFNRLQPLFRKRRGYLNLAILVLNCFASGIKLGSW